MEDAAGRFHASVVFRRELFDRMGGWLCVPDQVSGIEVFVEMGEVLVRSVEFRGNFWQVILRHFGDLTKLRVLKVLPVRIDGGRRRLKDVGQ